MSMRMGRTLKTLGSKTETADYLEHNKVAPVTVGADYLVADRENQGLDTRSPEMAMAAAALTGV